MGEVVEGLGDQRVEQHGQQMRFKRRVSMTTQISKEEKEEEIRIETCQLRCCECGALLREYKWIGSCK